MIKGWHEDIVVNCRTEKEAKEFCKLLHENGYKWIMGNSLNDRTYWHRYKKNTIYIQSNFSKSRVGFNEKFSAQIGGYAVVTYPEFLQLTKKDKPTIAEHIITDNKTVIKLSNGRVGIARCNPEDEFNVLTGTEIALKRAYGIEPFSCTNSNIAKEPKPTHAKNLIGKYAVRVKPVNGDKSYMDTPIKILKADDCGLMYEYRLCGTDTIGYLSAEWVNDWIDRTDWVREKQKC